MANLDWGIYSLHYFLVTLSVSAFSRQNDWPLTIQNKLKPKKVALRNLELYFPKMSDAERQIMLKRNFENTAIALLETGMGWWWPNWRVKRHTKIIGLEQI